jgi:hypothetical protein
LIEKFEAKWKASNNNNNNSSRTTKRIKSTDSANDSATSTSNGTKKKKRQQETGIKGNEPIENGKDNRNGFDKGYIAEKILGATDAGGQLHFLIKWKNSNKADLVSAKIANVKCPQTVIAFYEERLSWNSTDDEPTEPSKYNQID